MQVLGLADSTPKPTSRLKELFWPNLSSEPNAQSACENASIACFVIAGLTAIFALATTKWALLDAALFLIIGLGLRRMWRPFALVGFLLYLLEQLLVVIQGRFPGVLAILFIAILFNGVRASFAYWRMRKQAEVIGQAAEHC
jgi:hypothetical protein